MLRARAAASSGREQEAGGLRHSIAINNEGGRLMCPACMASAALIGGQRDVDRRH